MWKVVLLITLTWVVRSSIALQGVNKTLDVAPGYPVEEYFVETSDGYILKLFRIPGSPTSPKKDGKTIVFLLHGNLCSASDWLVLGPEKALAYLLADAGYDVWLGNLRGNTFSRAHVSLSHGNKEFWQFTLTEPGIIDLPMMIDFVLEETQQETLHFIGHSQGNTAFFMMASELPEYNKKIASMQAFAPSVYIKNAISPLYRLAAPLSRVFDSLFDLLGIYDNLSADKPFVIKIRKFCSANPQNSELCKIIFFLMFGFDPVQFERELVPKVFAISPAGGSMKQFIHYLQYGVSGKFQKFNYGEGNLAKYGTCVTPAFNLTKITAPVFLHYGLNDWVAAKKDVMRVADELGNLAGVREVPWKYFNHIDYIYAKDAKTLIYDSALKIISDNLPVKSSN